MVEKAIAAVTDDDVRFAPPRYKDIYLRWMENIRDWPISRQLWWGHRMPVWRKLSGDADDQTSYVVARTKEEAAARAGTTDIEQIEDVLDTWFSSALWPFATLGWPQSNADLKYYYPTQGLFTAQEILYLWVARMIMTGEEFIGEKPFDDVYIHATILDEKGRRMSKSLGNGVDPVDLINLYGADALRFMLMREAGQRQDIRIKPIRDEKQEQGERARNFCNKIWNASRFALMNLEGFGFRASGFGQTERAGASPAPTEESGVGAGLDPALTPDPALSSEALIDRWILSRLDATAEAVNAALATYNMDDAARAMYEFFWDDFCDWYIEAAKPRFQGEGASEAKQVLWFTLERALRLMHPILPFLTEAIWQALPGAKEAAGVEFLMLAPFPQAGVAARDIQAEAEWAAVQEVTRAIRNLQGENNLKKGGPAYFAPAEDAARAVIEANAPIIEFLTRFAPLTIGRGEGDILLSPTRYGDVILPRPPASAEDLAAEKGRIEKELAKIEKDLAGLMGRLENPAFVDSAPEAVVTKARQQAAELEDKKAKLSERLTI